MRDNLEPELREGLQELGNEARRAANLTRQLLMFSRRSVLVAKPVELNAVVANLLRMLNRVIGENIQLRFESDGGLPLVEADPGMLEQVLMNLVVNARDSMPKGGRVSIVTSHHRFEAGDPAYPDRRAGRFVSLAVSDTGSGIDPAILRRIFDPFFTTKEPGVGTGLGLSTVHGIAAQHKGWVEVESKVGQGTSFRVFFPALKDSCIPEDLTPRQEAPLDRGTETILVVEDNGSVLVQLAQSLRLLGYAVHTASNGWQALEVWHRLQGKVDLLITDMVMPEGMTGLELAERLRSFRAGLPVIVSSGYSAEMVHSGIPCHSGVVFLSKPFTTKALVELVRRSLDESKGGHVSKGGFDAENPSKLYTES
jgi:CheY-like chemotaxis protein